MKKTAVIYDKWLDSLGGGEVVACSVAKILNDNNYNVTIVCRKKVSPEAIFKKLNIKITNIKFVEIWNDEGRIQEITRGKDLFINISFIDYSIGLAKKNIYYAHFPTPTSINLKSYLTNDLFLPFIAKYIRPVEFINPPIVTVYNSNNVSYLLGNHTKIAFSYLNTKQVYNLRFFVFHELISKTTLFNTSYNLTDSNIIYSNTTIDNQHNVLRYDIQFKPNKPTTYFNFYNHNVNSRRIYLIEPKIFQGQIINLFSKYFENRLSAKIRAGIFNNVKSRIDTYKSIIVHSQYVAYWVEKYWNRKSIVLYPPVEMLYEKQGVDDTTKKNFICSVGRFFTLGHGKRQDILIEAFRKMCNNGLKGWQLHLAGGLGTEPSSIKYLAKLKQMAKGYPIIFHINPPRKEIEDLYFQSKIYWHAAGYGLNKNKYPIKFEHFGITPVEAVSAGCIPLLFNGGGLPEIIKLLDMPTNIHLFNSINELSSHTLTIIDRIDSLKITDNVRDKLKELFGQKTFNARFEKIIGLNKAK